MHVLRFQDGPDDTPTKVLSAHASCHAVIGAELAAIAAEKRLPIGELDLLGTIDGWQLGSEIVPTISGTLLSIPSGKHTIAKVLASSFVSEIIVLSRKNAIVRCDTGWYRLGDQVSRS